MPCTFLLFRQMCDGDESWRRRSEERHDSLSESNTTDHCWRRKNLNIYQLNSELRVTSVVNSWLKEKSINWRARYPQRHHKAYRNTGKKQQPWRVAGAIMGAEPVTAGIILHAGKWTRTNRNNTVLWMTLPEHRGQPRSAAGVITGAGKLGASGVIPRAGKNSRKNKVRTD